MDILKKPRWLMKKLPKSENYLKNLILMKENGLNTVCSDANCPNIEECFENNKATFMILGNNCTRNCKYCNISKDSPSNIDPEEPKNIINAINILGIKYVVITSVTRDDLPDYGLSHFLKTINVIKTSAPDIRLEILIPDFKGDMLLISKLIDSDVDIINHNIETVKDLFPSVRPMGDYDLSLGILKYIKEKKKNQLTKSGLMIGLGEDFEQIKKCIMDLKDASVDIITIGQYLQPSKSHHPVKRYYTNEEFALLKAFAESIGIKYVFSGPFIRSSYCAEDVFNTAVDNYEKTKIAVKNTVENTICKQVSGGKLINIYIKISKNINVIKIENISISGDFFVFPMDGIERLEAFLKNKKINENLKKEIDLFFDENKINVSGFSTLDLDNMIKEASK